MITLDRPTGCRFWTADDLIEWISVHVPADKLGNQSAYDAALWWKANIDADSFSEMNRRELADMRLNGFPPISADDVTDEIQAPHLDEPPSESTKELDTILETELRVWFDLKWNGY